MVSRLHMWLPPKHSGRPINILIPININKQIEFLERIYDIWQESSLDEVQDGVARLETHQDKEQTQEQKQIIIVCKDERDGINPDTNKLYDGLNMCDKNMITSKKICRN